MESKNNEQEEQKNEQEQVDSLGSDDEFGGIVHQKSEG